MSMNKAISYRECGGYDNVQVECSNILMNMQSHTTSCDEDLEGINNEQVSQ